MFAALDGQKYVGHIFTNLKENKLPTFTLLHGDVLSMLTQLEDNSVDSVVSDPPYELGFMGKGWDSTGITYSVPMWKEVLRVLKPGGHLLSFGGSRTYHRMASAVEDAGFEIRDQIMWVYGSGFPKSLDVSKAIDKAGGAEREVVGQGKGRTGAAAQPNGGSLHSDDNYQWPGNFDITKPTTETAKQWDGWGTALKPAHEPIVVARKPLIGTVVSNVLTHGTGAINIGACRVGTEAVPSNKLEQWSGFGELKRPAYTQTINVGRWPANLIHDGSDEVENEFAKAGVRSPGRFPKNSGGIGTDSGIYSKGVGRDQTERTLEAVTPAKFFYCAKANKKDREEGNTHPTVKPTELMRYLVRLVTPPSGTVLDHLCGSGSTGKAALLEGFNFIGIEKEEGHVEIARRRLQKVQAE